MLNKVCSDIKEARSWKFLRDGFMKIRVEVLLILLATVISQEIFKPKKSNENPFKTVLKIQNQKNQTSVKIMCLCLTFPSKENYVESVLKTWGPKCDKLMFVTLKLKMNVKLVPLVNITESRANLWRKVMQAFKYAYTHHRNEFDWFMKADDDTYFFMENLKTFLSKYDPNKPYFFGNQTLTSTHIVIHHFLLTFYINMQVCN
ncbi:Glycoprotein-N-acetylgalactosamine 3-beta-galactosyltransferase 1 [Thelohanellus kitauei]|uniref:N-acetylgalactosaminide beta-1,3-galactosyltransferase n=1 Tax=Thelohanellus kitauei TaxID=669202 RepID=A0A0C2MIT8_THEKT|nr:Glycoprotein-N-acetylgalactosamine 3-beta-galactosyltransferase 1 [Thelohanellus kitauei]